ncbi:hypothetical protein JFU37_04425 [Pseudomonas sp. TH41]|uniref:hypothetical protein n=1 Tax=Pseudomonas sp. TH41 TaxID=2796405 RepID=UPI0019147DC2|nr:hypothetical protein [Pseudomonas sp. TH41]MBK5351759.1 hypothetical protein [Pseudomonas sp. TH41]
MKAGYLRGAILTLLFYNVSSLSIAADTKDDSTLEKQKEALLTIRDFATSICDSVKAQGKATAWEGSTGAKAKLGGVVKIISDLGVEGAEKYKSSEYEGVLQTDLSKVLTEQGSCRHSVFVELKDKLIPDAVAIKPIVSSSARDSILGRFGLTVKEVEDNNDITTSLHKSEEEGTLWIEYKQPLFGKIFTVAQSLDDSKKTEMARAYYSLYGGDGSLFKNADFAEAHSMCTITRYNSMLSKLIERFGIPTDIKDPSEEEAYSNEGGTTYKGISKTAGAGWRFSDESKLLFQIRSSEKERVYGNAQITWKCVVQLCAIPKGWKKSCFEIPGIEL